MSSPVHHPQDLDAALMYAPPWARKSHRSAAVEGTDPVITSQIEGDEPAFDGDRAMLALRHRLSLDPEIVPSPIVIDRGLRLDQIALRLCAVATIAALVTWAVASLPAKPGEDTSVQAAAVPPVLPLSAKVLHVSEVPQAPPQQTALPQQAAMVASPVLASALSAMSEPLSQSAPVAVPSQQAGVPQTADAPPALGGAEIAMLIKSGKRQLMNGDISAARLLLQRAAEAGSAEAALALGSTFDPVVIRQLGAVGVQGDAATAREWYQRAAQAGSRAAAQQLAKLAATGQ
jgi:TPR repeat protein